MQIARAIRVATPKRAFVRALGRHYASVSESQRPLKQEDKKEFYQVSSQMVNRAAQGDRDFSNQEAAIFSSPEEDDAAFAFVDPEEEFPYSFIKPGSFVELRRNGRTCYGITLSMQYTNMRWCLLTLISTGSTFKHLPTDVMYLIPSVASSDLISLAGADLVATSRASEVARVEILKKVLEIERSLFDTYSVVGKANVENFYQTVRSPDPHQWSKVTTAQAYDALSGKVDDPMMARFATHKLLMTFSKYFSADPLSFLQTETFHVRPQQHVDEINAVWEMRQFNRSSIHRFVSKAKRVLALNRDRVNKSGDLLPSKTLPHGTIFDKEDLRILGFLLRALGTKRSIQKDPYQNGVAFLMRKLSPKSADYDDSLLYQLLIDLSIIPPWFDLTTYRPELELDHSPENSLTTMKRQSNIAVKGLQSSTTNVANSLPLGPQDFYPSDPLASLRHDFGDMPVYVIDDADAEELDDGISIERIPTEPTSDWVHVHIADPTAVIPPTHVLAQQARRAVETQYYIYRTWPMLPRSLTEQRIGLGTVKNGQPQCVLTFSFKIDKAGDITDYKIRAGIVRNVHVMDYNATDLAMGIQRPPYLYPFGGSRPLPPPARLNRSQIDDLCALDAVKQRLVAQRLTLHSFFLFTAKNYVDLSPRNIEQIPALNFRPTGFLGFPQLTFKLDSKDTFAEGTRGLVAELMKGAGRVASRFCRDRGVPAIRRAVKSVTFPSEDVFADVMAKRDSGGIVDLADVMHYDIVLPQAELSLEPKMHWTLGIPGGEGYTLVTSPLRRFPDLLMHWQIKHALLHPTAKPLFSETELRGVMDEIQVRVRALRGASQHHMKFWSVVFFKRWMEGLIPRDPNLPNPLENMVGIVTKPSSIDYMSRENKGQVRIPSIGAIGVLKGLKFWENAEVGERLSVSVESLTLGRTPRIEVVKA